jgi:hypothetical protein
MVSNYSVTECHNTGIDGSIDWFNIEICDMTKEQLDKILEVVKPMFVRECQREELEHKRWEHEQKKLKKEQEKK